MAQSRRNETLLTLRSTPFPLHPILLVRNDSDGHMWLSREEWQSGEEGSPRLLVQVNTALNVLGAFAISRVVSAGLAKCEPLPPLLLEPSSPHRTHLVPHKSRAIEIHEHRPWISEHTARRRSSPAGSPLHLRSCLPPSTQSLSILTRRHELTPGSPSQSGGHRSCPRRCGTRNSRRGSSPRFEPPWSRVEGK